MTPHRVGQTRQTWQIIASAGWLAILLLVIGVMDTQPAHAADGTIDIGAVEVPLNDATFANIAGFHQSYPDAVGAGTHPAQTGASALNSLGYTFVEHPMDAVYRIERTFAHTSSSLTLDFTAQGLQIIEDESWGIDNITVTVSATDPSRSQSPATDAADLWQPAVNQ